jgi:segregation and condensation protein B
MTEEKQQQTKTPVEDVRTDTGADERDGPSAQEPEEAAVDEQMEAEVDKAGDLPPQDPDFAPTVESVIEAVLFASDESLTVARLADIVETGAKQVREHVENLNKKYTANNNAFRIEQIAGGYQMLTLSPYNHWLQKLLRARSDSKLSAASLETLAIVAYKQPVIRADIEAIRGVAVGEVIRGLMYKGLVKIVGRAEVLGRPMLYGTTRRFLEVFGLNSLKDLPKVEEFKKPPA